MYCKQCGKELEEGMRFCIYCGQDQSGPVRIVSYTEEKSTIPSTGRNESKPLNREKDNKRRNVALVIVAIICALTAVLFLAFFLTRTKSSEEEPEAARVEISTETKEQEPESETEEPKVAEKITEKKETETEFEVDNSPFGIDGNTVADYSACLNPGEYAYYDSGMAFFQFFYPKKLFNRVEVDQEVHALAIGDQSANNIESVQFYASDGTEVLFQVLNRLAPGGVDPRLRELYEAEDQMRFAGTGEGDLHYENGYGYCSLAGYQNGKEIYEYIRMDNSQIYRFFVIKPSLEDPEKRLQMEYVMSSMEHMTGFSHSKEILPYETFLEKNGRSAYGGGAASSGQGIMLPQDRVDFLFDTYGGAKGKYSMTEPEFTHRGLYESFASELSVTSQYDGYHDGEWVALDSDPCLEFIGKMRDIFPEYREAVTAESFVSSVYAEGRWPGEASCRYTEEGYAEYGGSYLEIFIPVFAPDGTARNVTLIVDSVPNGSFYQIEPEKTVILVRDYIPLN